MVANVSSDLGGVLAAGDACELPHDKQQVSQARSRLKRNALTSEGASGDELGVIVQQASWWINQTSLFERSKDGA